MDEKIEDNSVIAQAQRQREALQKENERLEKNIKELREIEANALLAGTAGKGIPRVTPEEQREAKVKAMADEITKAFRR